MEGYHLSSAEAPTSLQVHIISWKPALTRPSLKIWKEPPIQVTSTPIHESDFGIIDWRPSFIETILNWHKN